MRLSSCRCIPQQLCGLHHKLQVYEAKYTISCKSWAAAGFVDTDLSFLRFLELYGARVSERRMTARRVVEPFDVVKQVGAGLLLGAVNLSCHPFRLH